MAFISIPLSFSFSLFLIGCFAFANEVGAGRFARCPSLSPSPLGATPSARHAPVKCALPRALCPSLALFLISNLFFLRFLPRDTPISREDRNSKKACPGHRCRREIVSGGKVSPDGGRTRSRIVPGCRRSSRRTRALARTRQ